MSRAADVKARERTITGKDRIGEREAEKASGKPGQASEVTSKARMFARTLGRLSAYFWYRRQQQQSRTKETCKVMKDRNTQGKEEGSRQRKSESSLSVCRLSLSSSTRPVTCLPLLMPSFTSPL